MEVQGVAQPSLALILGMVLPLPTPPLVTFLFHSHLGLAPGSRCSPTIGLWGAPVASPFPLFQVRMPSHPLPVANSTLHHTSALFFSSSEASSEGTSQGLNPAAMALPGLSIPMPHAGDQGSECVVGTGCLVTHPAWHRPGILGARLSC